MLNFLAYFCNMSIMKTSIYIYLDVYDFIYKIKLHYIGNYIDLRGFFFVASKDYLEATNYCLCIRCINVCL